MKLTCEIVQDLLPLYEDNVCSPGSREAVEEHLKECENCRVKREQAKRLPEVELEETAVVEKKKFSRALKKIQFRAVVTWLAVIAVVSMSFSQCYGFGLCFTNWDEVWIAKQFTGYLEKGEYEKAAQLIDYQYSYEYYRRTLEVPLEDYQYDFTRIELDGEVWYLWSNILYNFEEPYDADEIWEWMIFDQHGGMIPMDIWMGIASKEGIKVKGTGGGYAISKNTDTEVFRELETLWGTYMVHERSWEDMENSEKTLLDYGTTFYMMPEAAYLDVAPVLEAYAEERYQKAQADYVYVLDMTLEEFAAYQRSKYVEVLEVFFAQGYTLTEGWVKGLSYAGYSGGNGWTVEIQGNVLVDENRYPIELLVHVQDDKVAILNYYFKDPPEWANEFYKVLDFSR